MEIVTRREEWNRELAQFSEVMDVYFNFDYFDIFASHYHARPEALVWEDPNISVFWSHLVREIPDAPGNPQFFSDLITPYGYGGPLIHYKSTAPSKIQASLHSFMEEYFEFARERHYVSEFIRFHPILKNWEPFREDFQKLIVLDYNNDTVYIDLTKGIDEIWQEIRKGHRYNIKKTERERCEVNIVENPSDSDIDAFIALYHQTMKNNCASDKYLFTPSFIKDHFSRLSAVLVRADYCGQLIGASMFIAGDSCINYHLSGSDKSPKGVYPSELIIWNVIEWAKKRDFRIFHLGGGLKKDDPLFNFKKGFSRLIAPFFTGKIIFDHNQYQSLTQSKMNPNTNENFFPAYRDEKSGMIL
ncbi:MAG: GNAT family N-acetyltransferase [Methanoregula sp.]